MFRDWHWQKLVSVGLLMSFTGCLLGFQGVFPRVSMSNVHAKRPAVLDFRKKNTQKTSHLSFQKTDSFYLSPTVSVVLRPYQRWSDAQDGTGASEKCP